jgi:hypothetical protein
MLDQDYAICAALKDISKANDGTPIAYNLHLLTSELKSINTEL